MNKTFLHTLAVLIIGLFSVAQLAAQASLSVQGSLQNFNGTAVDNGVYDITFKLYTTDAGGTAIWSETQSVNLVGGVYSVLLGEVNPLNVPFDQTYYLGLTIPGGPEHTPRARLTSSPYALSLIGQDNVFPSTGNVGIGTTTPGTTLAVDGSIGTGQATTTATAYTVAADDHVIFLDHTANQNVTLPAATAANAGRHLMLVNKEAVAKTLTASNYVDLTGATATNVPANGVVELQSDGSVWRQTGGYVTPTAQAKAYVYCTNATSQTNIPYSSLHTILYTEISDAQNCFANNTFTAPRTGIYHFSGYNFVYSAGQTAFSEYAIRSGGTAGGDVIRSAKSIPPAYGRDTYINFSFSLAMTAGQTAIIQLSNLGSNVATYNAGAGGNLTITEN